jgi:hypothetical protein
LTTRRLFGRRRTKRLQHAGEKPAEESIMDTQTQTTTEHGTNGTYRTGIEYTVDAQHVHHEVRRPIERRIFLGYGADTGDVGLAIIMIDHRGPLTEWRSSGWGDHSQMRPVLRPMSPPYLNLPDEEHGCVWGDPIDVPSTEPARFLFRDREITAQEAEALLCAYRAAQPDPGTYYALHAPTGIMMRGLASMHEARCWLARVEGCTSSDLTCVDRSSSCGSELQADVMLGEEGIGTIGDSVAIQPPSGDGVDRSIARAALRAVGYREDAVEDFDDDRVEDLILGHVAAIENGAVELMGAGERRRRARLPEVVELTRANRLRGALAMGDVGRGLIPGGEDEAAYTAAVDAGQADPDPVWA